MIKAVLSGMGQALPPTALTSEALEAKLAPLYERLNLPQGRLELMTGIKERRLWERGARPSDLAVQAAEDLFQNSAIKKKEIDLIIHASVCRDFLEPATASVVHAKLGLSESCELFDLSNACLGVLSSTKLAQTLIESGKYRHILIVSGENAGPLVEATIERLLTDMTITRKSMKLIFANLTIGSAAVAWTISREDLSPHSPLIEACTTLTDSSANTLCQGGGNTHELVMETDSEALLVKGIALAKKTWDSHREKLPALPDWVLGHQVGSAHEKLVLEACGLEKTKTHITYPWLGNTGSAALPITLNELARKNELKNQDQLALLGIGSGLVCTVLSLRWRTP